MKKYFLLFLFFSFVPAFCFSTPKYDSRLLAETPKYILFDNLEEANFVDSAYWNYLSDPSIMPEIANFIIRKPFNDATLQQYNLANFDVSIFLLGDNKLNTRVGSVSVLNALRQIISAGKNAMIIGRRALWYAFNPESPDKNPEVQKFLTDTLGIDYLTFLKVSRQEGNTIYYWSFNIRGAFGDPVGMSVIKWCNIIYNPAPGIDWTPLAIYLGFDVFRSRDPQKYPPVDHFIRTNNAYPNDTIVGIRTEIGTSRLCFWSIGFEAFAGDIPRSSQIQRAMTWLKGNIAPDGAAYDLEPPVVEFGSVQIDSASELEVTITSTGKLDLVIDEIDFWENPDSVFEIVSGKITSNKPKTLKRGQSHTFTIRFKPKEKIEYKGTISIHTNALYQEYRYLDIWGYGGILQKGPQISTSAVGDTIDFGFVSRPTSQKIDFKIYNTGDRDLEIREFEIDTTFGDHSQFDIAQTLNKPFTIVPNDSTTIKLRFSAAVNEERAYIGRLHIETNIERQNHLYIYLVAFASGYVKVIEPNQTNSQIFTISPNPSNGNFIILFNKNIDDFNSIEITDLNGRLLSKITGNNITFPLISFENLDLPSGTYFVIMRMSNSVLVNTLVILK
ncbi:MAG: choice-of-anchor D domain-containing protein [Candidatus Kapaibacteriales bacterium]